MYQQYFGLHQTPFSITPDPAFLYLSQHHREALAHLQYVAENNGFVLLSGEIGSGKTTLIRQFLQQLPSNVDTAVILNPRLSATELIGEILRDLSRMDPKGMTHQQVLKHLNDQLFLAHSQGRRVVLIVDEAQDLDIDLLEQLRLLTNLETAQHKLLQIILVGQPELRSVVQQPELEQLLQRITADFHLHTLPNEEIGPYIDHRLTVAGAQRQLFTKRAITAIGKTSRGVPRLINALCDRALLGAYSEQSGVVDQRIVKRASSELLSLAKPKTEGWLARGIIYLSASTALIGTIAAGWLLWQINISQPRPPIHTMAASQSPPPTAAAKPQTPEHIETQKESSTARTTPPVSEPLAHQTLVQATDHTRAISDTIKPEQHPAPIPEPNPAPSQAPSQAQPQTAQAPTAQPPKEHSNTIQNLPIDSLNQPSQITSAPPQSAETTTPLPQLLPQDEASSLDSQRPLEPSQQDSNQQQTNPPTPPHPDKANQQLAASNPFQQTSPITEIRLAPSVTTNLSAMSKPAKTTKLGMVPPPQQIAIQNLFQAWDLDYTKLKGWPCQRANSQGLRCIRSISGIAGLKNLNRPALLELSIPGSDATQPVVIIEYGDQQGAVVLTAHGKKQLSKAQLQAQWAGEFLTLWRPPKDYWRAIRKPNETANWVPTLRKQLAKLGFKPRPEKRRKAYDKTLISSVKRFQKTQGLRPDGLAGKSTLMRINTLLGTAPVIHTSRPFTPSTTAQ